MGDEFESLDLTGVAIAALRIELLYAATGYGVYSATSEADESLLREWRGWLEWLDGFIARVVAGLDDGRNDLSPPDWLSEADGLLEALAQTGERRPDVVTDERFRQWAKLELERLAERARPVEETAGEPLGEIKGMRYISGISLLGVVQDSLLLLTSDDEDLRSRRASAAEVYELVVAARKEGVWGVLLDD